MALSKHKAKYFEETEEYGKMWKTLLNSTFYFPFKTLTEYKLEFVSELLKLEEALTYHPHDLDLI